MNEVVSRIAKLKPLAIALGGSFAVLSPAHAGAETISVNFYLRVGDQPRASNFQLAPTDVAGAAPASNWNNVASDFASNGFNAGSPNLKNSSGVSTGTSVAVAGRETFATDSTYSAANSAADPNYKLFNSYFGAANDDNLSINVSGLSSAFTTPGYDVYVYFDGENVNGNREPKDRVAEFFLGTTGFDGNRTTFDSLDSKAGRDGSMPTNFGGKFVESNGTTELVDSGTDGIPDASTRNRLDAENAPFNTPEGNFVVFRNVNLSKFTIYALGGDSQDFTYRAPVSGFQIVAVPEPMAAAGLLIGMGGLLTRRSRWTGGRQENK